MESEVVKRFWKAENTTLTFYPVDEEQPRLGGKVKASVMGINFQTLTPFMRTYHGVYGEDFITYGTIVSNGADPLNDDETLLKAIDGSMEECTDRHSFRFENDQVWYSRQVNGAHHDAEVEHEIAMTPLQPLIYQTWSETLFYGAGNRNM